MRTIFRVLLMSVSLLGLSAAWADEGRPYTEGSIVSLGYIRTKYGMFDEYMKFLDGPYKQMMEEQKKAGVVLEYSVYEAFPHNPSEPDIVLVVVYKNWAAMDGLRDKLDPIEAKIFGSLDASNKGAADREKMREVLGGQLLQRLNLK